MPVFKRALLASLLAALTTAVIVRSYQAQPAVDDSARATYSHGVLRLIIPYLAVESGNGQLTVDILDPEDAPIGHLQKGAEIAQGHGAWHEDLKLDRPLALDDLMWHRVRYRFTAAGSHQPPIEGIESLTQMLRTPVVHVIGQQSYLSGGEAAVRVIVTDSGNQPIEGAGSLQIDLLTPDRKSQVLYTGKLNQRGTAEAQFRFPAGLAGSYPLRYSVDTPIGSTEASQPVTLEEKTQVLLTTEKPIYQPGQTIHARALALDRASHEATANRKLIFEVEDSRGNKVFKKATQTDEFGVASADFALADEVNLGSYHLRAAMEPKTTAELAINVDRYVLPKFKVALELAGKDNTKHGYRPGDHVTGTVRANYFFGKPVDGGEVTVKASAMDVAVFQAGAVNGKTDSDGAWHFDLQLPPYFAGRPIDKGAAQVLVEATVKDSAGHSESRAEPITVSEQPILITAIPEGGMLIPGFENQVFIVTAYPDGQPAATQIKVRGESADTDAAGVAVIRLRAGHGVEMLAIEARDKAGNEELQSVSLASRTGSDQILLRTDRAVYRAGDRISLHVFSTRQRGTAYIDAVKAGQTMLTRDVDLRNGEAELTLTATPGLAGTVDFHAYLIGGNAQTVADHRLAFVQPADELKIVAAADSASYKPGDDARIRFRITNSRGEGVRAALGLQVVDEAVFALAEKQPGFAKVFFYLEQEVMKPRYEIHSIGMPEVVTTGANRDLAGRALFAAADVVSPRGFDREFGRTLPDNRYWEYRTRYWQRFEQQAGKLAERFSSIYAQDPDAGALSQLMAKLVAAHDPLVRDSWGNDLVLEHPTWMQRDEFQLRSTASFQRNGAYGLALLLHVNRGTVLRNPHPGGTIDVSMEHDRGPFNGLAEIAGKVFDASGAAVPGVLVTARSSTGKTMTTLAGEDGDFQFLGVLPGHYNLQIVSLGFRAASCELALQARDRAVLSVKLEVRQITESVEVSTGGSARQFVAGGTVGGVIGGIVGAVPSAAPAPPPMAAVPLRIRVGGNVQLTHDGAILNGVKVNTESAAPHVRSWFPESLYINPEIITDKNGAATIAIPMADSITTWHMSMLASTTHGALGSGTSNLKVFQDFFADLDLPVTLTQGDRVSIPVALYNYSGSNGSVSVHLQPEDWYTLVSDAPDKIVPVESGRVGAAQFTLEARRIGKFKLTLSARLTGGITRADVLVREIEVVPNGREQTVVFNGHLEGAAEHAIDFPAGAIPDASKIFARIYPSPISQVIEGMDSILRMPGGCFEQTSSSTYPNVLTLDYMKHTKKLTPEIHAKAEGYIANGYQRLLTFEVPGGGFSWFGQAPANKILTAYGLMEFSDMAKVYDVDPNVIWRTQQWLASQQQGDGSWKPDTQFINEGATNRYNSDVLRITAYVAWALENTGYHGPVVEKARHYIAERMDRPVDAYTLAVLANFAVDYAKDRAFAGKTLSLLLDAARSEGERTSWTAEETGVYGGGTSASVETTGLAVQALLKSGENSSVATKALAYIASKKDANGAWGTTQATIMALRALLLSAEKGADARGNIELTLNGKPVQKLELTPENNDLLQQFVFKAADLQAHNTVGVRFDGNGALAYQVVGSYFLPWDAKPANEPLSIDVDYDRAQLAQDDIATATATIRNNLPKTANMVMVDLGIPPGFDLLTEDLQDYREKQAGAVSGHLQKFSLTATQAILYFDSFAPGDTVLVKYRLRAKYPIRARTFPSRVYEYYQPEVNAIARPVQLEVRKK